MDAITTFRGWSNLQFGNGASDAFNGGPVYNMGTISGNVTPDLYYGIVQICWMTDDTVFFAPSGSPVEGLTEMTVVIQFSDGTHTVDFDPSIRQPSEGGGTYPKTLEAWKSYLFTLRFMGGVWCLTSFVGGFQEVVD